MSKWSNWQEVSSIKDFPKDIDRLPGVYLVRLSKSLGQPEPIGRLLGSDECGLLAIGESKNLAIRIKQFYHAYEKPENKSSTGDRLFFIRALHYSNWKTSNHGPKIEFSVMKLSSKAEAQTKEGELLSDYFRKYGELPPLNSNMPHEGWKKLITNLSSSIS